MDYIKLPVLAQMAGRDGLRPAFQNIHIHGGMAWATDATALVGVPVDLLPPFEAAGKWPRLAIHWKEWKKVEGKKWKDVYTVPVKAGGVDPEKEHGAITLEFHPPRNKRGRAAGKTVRITARRANEVGQYTDGKGYKVGVPELRAVVPEFSAQEWCGAPAGGGYPAVNFTVLANVGRFLKFQYGAHAIALHYNPESSARTVWISPANNYQEWKRDGVICIVMPEIVRDAPGHI